MDHPHSLLREAMIRCWEKRLTMGVKNVLIFTDDSPFVSLLLPIRVKQAFRLTCDMTLSVVSGM